MLSPARTPARTHPPTRSRLAQLRNPALRGQPVGVTQKYLVVTANYAARAAGVGKLMAIAEARAKCPGLVLVSGEDLTPFRQASKRVEATLRRYGPTERLGLDEVFVDVTAEVCVLVGGADVRRASREQAPCPPGCTHMTSVRLRTLQAQRRVAAASAPGAPPDSLRWHGHVHSGATRLVQDSKHRPMDLRAAAAAEGVGQQVGSLVGALASSPAPDWVPLLMAGSAIAAEARAAVRAEAGVRTSAGIACNKLLAKLSRCGGGHGGVGTAAATAPRLSTGALGLLQPRPHTPSSLCSPPVACTSLTTRPSWPPQRAPRSWRRCLCAPCPAWVSGDARARGRWGSIKGAPTPRLPAHPPRKCWLLPSPPRTPPPRLQAGA